MVYSSLNWTGDNETDIRCITDGHIVVESIIMITIRILIACLFLGMFAACGQAVNVDPPTAEPRGETMKDIGDHVVHFSALTTDRLPPEIARTYSIVRSKDRAMLNVSIVAKANQKSVPAEVVVKASNLTGQVKSITIRRIDEQEAIYYIGDTPVANRETLIFDLSVTPDGVDRPSDIRFMHEFYTD